MMQFQQSKLYRLLEPGSNLHCIEFILFYGLVFWFYTLDPDVDVDNNDKSSLWDKEVHDLAVWNVKCQLLIFTFIVQIPTFITGHMSYVDIGWPMGLTVLAINILWYENHHSNAATTTTNNNNQQQHIRTILIGGALLLHGFRMFVGALYILYPYKWDNDLSRYQYAKQRWIQQTGDESLWFLKQQHDTLMQAYANCVVVAIPLLLTTTNPHQSSSDKIAFLHPLEWMGFIAWICFWCLENWCDISKLIWEIQAKKNGDDIQTAVLGYDKPYNHGLAFWPWTICRHPNYFFEWMCWNSFLVMSLPSVLDYLSTNENDVELIPWTRTEKIVNKILLVLTMVYVSRLLYDCLVYWTGAAPAESRSTKRRPHYKDFQRSTNVFFPINLPWFDHHRTPGWPLHTTTTTNNNNKEHAQ